MNLEKIKAEAHDFFEWPTGNKTAVLTTSALLFARHCVDIAVKQKQDRYDDFIECGWIELKNGILTNRWNTDGLKSGKYRLLAERIDELLYRNTNSRP